MNTKNSFFRQIFHGLIILSFFTLWACQNRIEEPFDESIAMDSLFTAPIDQGLVKNPKINEASGLVFSRSIQGALWTHNDSGGENALFLLNQAGDDLGKLILQGIENRDWEDISIGPGPKNNTTYLYVGDFGDNEAQHERGRIYRFPEPSSLVGAQTLPKKDIDIIRFVYPDGARDAETLMIDPFTRDIYIISKREDSVRIYVAPFPQSTKEVITLEKVGKLHFNKAIAGDISPDGQEILIKNYANIYYWTRNQDESVLEALQRQPRRLPYVREPQGEAIAWNLDASGFFTLSEERHRIPARLYFYKRQKEKP